MKVQGEQKFKTSIHIALDPAAESVRKYFKDDEMGISDYSDNKQESFWENLGDAIVRKILNDSMLDIKDAEIEISGFDVMDESLFHTEKENRVVECEFFLYGYKGISADYIPATWNEPEEFETDALSEAACDNRTRKATEEVLTELFDKQVCLDAEIYVDTDTEEDYERDDYGYDGHEDY